MSHKFEVNLDEETYKAVKKMAERGVGKGRGERKAVTIGEMCSALVRTGAFRRIAANKWAKEHPAKASKKPAAPRKAKSAKKGPVLVPAAQSEGMKPSLPAASAGVLD